MEDVKEDIALQLFYKTLRIRMVEEAIAEKYSEQQMRCPVHLSIGQEAIAVGVCAHLTARDYLISNHRAHAHYLAKGGNLKRMIAEIYGKETGCSSGRGGSMHLVDLDVGMLGSTPIVGGSIPVAVGAAFGSVLKGENRVTVLFIGEGATEEGVFSEALNFAALKKLPVLFVCENNFYSVYSPLSVRQPEERDRVAIAKAHGFFTKEGDGNRVEEVHQLSGLAIQHIREGKGPAYVEFTTYRFREHCGPNFDNNIGYREESEYLDWKKSCPVDAFLAYLLEKKLVSDLSIEEARKEIALEIEEAFDFAKSSPFPVYDPNVDTTYVRAL